MRSLFCPSRLPLKHQHFILSPSHSFSRCVALSFPLLHAAGLQQSRRESPPRPHHFRRSPCRIRLFSPNLFPPPLRAQNLLCEISRGAWGENSKPMASSRVVMLAFFVLSFADTGLAARHLLQTTPSTPTSPTTTHPEANVGALVQQQPLVLKYINGKLLKGRITVNLVWYGTFTPIQRSIIVDFIESLSTPQALLPSAAMGWKTTEKYKEGSSTLVVGKQILHKSYSLGKFLKARHLLALASKFNDLDSITVVLTAEDIAMDGLCVSWCGTDGKPSVPYVWVRNSETQSLCQCAWPFQQPIYSSQTLAGRRLLLGAPPSPSTSTDPTPEANAPPRPIS